MAQPQKRQSSSSSSSQQFRAGVVTVGARRYRTGGPKSDIRLVFHTALTREAARSRPARLKWSHLLNTSATTLRRYSLNILICVGVVHSSGVTFVVAATDGTWGGSSSSEPHDAIVRTKSVYGNARQRYGVSTLELTKLDRTAPVIPTFGPP